MSKYPRGVDLVERGDCPLDALTAMSCTYCSYGHMLECHYPLDCEEAECEHFIELQESEYGDFY